MNEHIDSLNHPGGHFGLYQSHGGLNYETRRITSDADTIQYWLFLRLRKIARTAGLDISDESIYDVVKRKTRGWRIK